MNSTILLLSQGGIDHHLLPQADTAVEAVCRSFVEVEEQRTRDEWERMRLLATMTIQPHVKNRLKPDKLLPLPWDGPKKAKVELVSKEEVRRRFEGMVDKKG